MFDNKEDEFLMHSQEIQDNDHRDTAMTMDNKGKYSQ